MLTMCTLQMFALLLLVVVVVVVLVVRENQSSQYGNIQSVSFMRNDDVKSEDGLFY